MNILSNFSKNLAQLIKEEGLTQENLGEKTQTERSSFSGFLNAKHLPSYKTLISIADHFQCSVDYLLGLKDVPTSEEASFYPAPPFGTRFRAVLKEFELSQYKLHKKYNIAYSVMTKWIKGEAQPSVDSLVRLAKIMDCSVDYLLGRVK